MRARYLFTLLFVLLLCSPTLALEANQLRDMFVAGDYQGVVNLCDANAGQIEQSEFADQVLLYCGQAKVALYEENGSTPMLTSAIEDLEMSLNMYYLHSTSFALGKARVMALDKTSTREEKRALIWKGLGEMWDAINKRHGDEGFTRAVVSDAILSYSLQYKKLITDLVIKEQDDPAMVMWLTARIRMLTDRFKQIDPSQGENETRQGNLDAVYSYMQELYEATYFDRNPVVGMYKYNGDSNEHDYMQDEETQEMFHKSLYYYNEGLFRVRIPKARAVLHERIAYLCSLYISEDKDKKIEFYKQGFHNAADGLVIMDRIAADKPERADRAYRFEPDNTDLIAQLQKHYGQNLSGLIYLMWERQDYQSVVALRQNVFDKGFDWKTKANDFLLIADSAAKLAISNVSDKIMYDKYKEMCLMSSSRAFKFSLAKFNGRWPTYDEEFCEAMNAYSGFLMQFGETVEASNLERTYGPVCQEPPAEPAALEVEVNP